MPARKRSRWKAATSASTWCVVFSIVLEGVPREVAAMITREVAAPTIGIGAGPECDGQVLVFHDIVNLTFAPPAKFVRRYGDAAELFATAVEQFKADVE